MSIFDVDTGPKTRRPTPKPPICVDEGAYLAALSSVAEAENRGIGTNKFAAKGEKTGGSSKAITAADGTVFASHAEYARHMKTQPAKISIANRIDRVELMIDGSPVESFEVATQIMGQKKSVKELVVRALKEGRSSVKRNGKVLEWTLAKGE